MSGLTQTTEPERPEEERGRDPASTPPVDRTRRRFVPTLRRRRISQGYSAVVTLLKVALPAAALGLAAVVALWPNLQERAEPDLTVEVPQTAEGNIQMTRPRFVGTDDAANPYTIVGATANRGAEGEHVVELSRVEADIALGNDTWMAVIGDFGRLDQQANTLFLQGGVALFRGDGYLLNSEVAHVDLATNTAWTDQPVIATGPAGAIEASGGAQYREGGDVIVFLGPSRLVLHGEASTDTASRLQGGPQ